MDDAHGRLLVASDLFCAAWNPPLVILLWLSTVVDWYAAKGLIRALRPAQRHACLLLSMIANVRMLGYFKYCSFVLENFRVGLLALGVDYQPPAWDNVLPVGISFYKFATMAYTLDVDLHPAQPRDTFSTTRCSSPSFRTSSPADHAADRAGTAVRTSTSRRFPRAHLRSRVDDAGLIQKVVLADTLLARRAEIAYDSDTLAGALDAWIATLAFSGHIFCDFAGYSTVAIGAATCVGFAMPANFHIPYAAIGFSDF